MDWKTLNLKKRLNMIAAAILLMGLGSAMTIYLTANDASESGYGFEIVNGTVYSTDPEHSKKYIRNLELYGGKANVMADEFGRWFDGLWQGKSLATTVAWLTVMISFGIFLFANQLPSDLKSDSRDQTRTG